MLVFVSPQCEVVNHGFTQVITLMYESLKEELEKKRICQRYFRECEFFSFALDSALVRNEHLLSCFARFSFKDSAIQIPVFFDVCHDRSGNGIAQFVFQKLIENNV